MATDNKMTEPVNVMLTDDKSLVKKLKKKTFHAYQDPNQNFLANTMTGVGGAMTDKGDMAGDYNEEEGKYCKKKVLIKLYLLF